MATMTNDMAFGGYARSSKRRPTSRRSRRSVVTLSQPNHPAAEQYRVLRYRLECLAKAGIKALAFTSPQSGEGKTTTAVNAALALGKGGRNRVVLVDADLRRPGVATMLGLRANKGLTDIVAGRASLDDCLWRFGADELYVLPAGTPPDDLAATLYDPRIGRSHGDAQVALRLRHRRHASGVAAGGRADAVARSRRRDHGRAREPHAEGAGQRGARRALRRDGARPRAQRGRSARGCRCCASHRTGRARRRLPAKR